MSKCAEMGSLARMQNLGTLGMEQELSEQTLTCHCLTVLATNFCLSCRLIDKLQPVGMETSEAAGSGTVLSVCPTPLSLPKGDPVGVGLTGSLCCGISLWLLSCRAVGIPQHCHW